MKTKRKDKTKTKGAIGKETDKEAEEGIQTENAFTFCVLAEAG